MQKIVGWVLIGLGAACLGVLGWLLFFPQPINVQARTVDDEVVNVTANRSNVILPGGCVATTWQVSPLTENFFSEYRVLHDTVCMIHPFLPTYVFHGQEPFLYKDVFRFDIVTQNVESLSLVLAAGLFFYLSSRAGVFPKLRSQYLLTGAAVVAGVVAVNYLVAVYMGPRLLRNFHFDDTMLTNNPTDMSLTIDGYRDDEGCIVLSWSADPIREVYINEGGRAGADTNRDCNPDTEQTVEILTTNDQRYLFRWFVNGPPPGSPLIQVAAATLLFSLYVGTWGQPFWEGRTVRLGFLGVGAALLFLQPAGLSAGGWLAGGVLLLALAGLVYRDDVVVALRSQDAVRLTTPALLVLLVFLAFILRQMVLAGADYLATWWVYRMGAEQIARDGVYTNIVYPPGYPLFLAPFYWLQLSEPTISSIQALVDSLFVVVTYYVLRRLDLRPAVSLVGAALYAILPSLASISIYRHAEALSAPLLLLALWAMLGVQRRVWLWAVVGLLNGYMAINRPDMLPVAILIAIAIVIFHWRDGLVRIAMSGALFAAGVVAVLGAWGGYNGAVNDNPDFTSGSGGVTLWGGLGQVPNDEYILYGAVGTIYFRALEQRGYEVNTWDRVANLFWYQTQEGNDIFYGDYFKVLQEHPMIFVNSAIYRIREILHFNDSMYIIQTDGEGLVPLGDRPAPLPVITRPLLFLVERFGFPLMLLATALRWRDLRLLVLMWIPLILAIGSIGLVYFEPRYVIYMHISHIIALGVVLQALLGRGEADPTPEASDDSQQAASPA